MIYTVECSFADPASEAEWNHFYSRDKLPGLISVTGFHTSQRFRAITPHSPTYFAAHSVDHADILTGEEYHRKGGGNFARWEQHITDWHRNLYAGLDRMPAVSEEEWLLMTERGPQSLNALGLSSPHMIEAIAMDKTPACRWLDTIRRSDMPDPASLPRDLHAYAAMTPQLTSHAT